MFPQESEGVCPPGPTGSTLLIWGWAWWFAKMKGQCFGLPLSLRPAAIEAPMTGNVTAGGSGHLRAGDLVLLSPTGLPGDG